MAGKYHILSKISPLYALFDLQVLGVMHRCFYLIYKPPALHCQQNERQAIYKNAVVCNLNSLSSSLVGSFCQISWLKHGNKLQSFIGWRRWLRY